MNSNRKWAGLIAGTIMLLFIGLIYGWSIFSKFLGEIFAGWDPSQLRQPFTLSIVFFCVGGFIAGNLTKKIKNRYVVLISAALLFAGFFLLSRVLNENDPDGSIIALNIFYGVMNGFGVGLSYNAILSAVMPWFPGKTGIASGILLLGFGVGSLVLANVVSNLVAFIGIFQTFFVIGLAVAGVLVIGSFFIKKPDVIPAPITPDVAKGGGAVAETGGGEAALLAVKRDYPLSETVRTSTFWLLFIWNVLICSGGLLVIGGAAQIAEAFGAAAVLGLIVSVFNGVGRPVNGTLYDMLGRKKAMIFNSCVMIAGGLTLLAGAITGSATLIFIGLPLMGICYGGSPALISAGTAGFFGQKHFAMNFAATTFCLVPGAFIAQEIVSKLQQGSGGSYNSTFIMIIILGAAAFAVNIALTVSAKKNSLE
jgi:OFA family oxalate/formate antiporter-like MFS transporter